jgi:hypothetical protein
LRNTGGSISRDKRKLRKTPGVRMTTGTLNRSGLGVYGYWQGRKIEMIKLVYSPEDNVPVTDDLCMVSLGIRAIINAMRSYTLDDTSSPEAGEVLVSVWPVLQVLIEPITDYFFERLGDTRNDAYP